MKRGLLRAYSAGFTALSRIADVVLVLGGGMLAYALRFRRVPDALPLGYAAVIAIAALLFPLLGVYRSWRARGLRAPAGQVLLGWVAVFVLILLMLVLTKDSDQFSRWWMGLWFLSTAAVLLLLRGGQHPAARVAELTPRQWKQHFAQNPLRSDLYAMDAGWARTPLSYRLRPRKSESAGESAH